MTALVYGAYGYTGELIARTAREQGFEIVLAGRDPERTRDVAARTGFSHRVFALDDPAALDAGLEGVQVVLHCAGPFSRTARPMAAACLRRRAHYLDITGEVDVFEAMAARDADAHSAGVMLMPGVGFDVVPSDCLAAHVADRVPGATALCLAFKGITKPSRGTAKTIVENLERGCVVRRDGALVTLPPASLRRSIDYGDGRKLASMAVAWGDVATAYRTTRIPNIEVYVPVPRAAQSLARIFASLGVFASPRLKRHLVRRIDAGPAGPSDAERARGKSLLWACAKDASGERSAQAWLTTPEGYSLTAVAALEITRRVLAGAAKPGFRTPAGLFGADFVLQFEGVARHDG